MNKENSLDIIKNPFCYHGSKARIMPLIIDNLPESCKFVVDMFGGSGEVCLNINKPCLYNEKNPYIYNLIKTIKNTSLEEILVHIESNINFYSLSKTNKQGYIGFRKYFNEITYKFLKNNDRSGVYANLDLLTLCFFSFNHQIVFNKEGKFSVPSGINRSAYNKSLENKLITYKNRLDKVEIQMWNDDFLSCYNKFVEFYPNFLDGSILFMIDPPYLLSDSVYSRTYGMKWTDNDEKHLYDMLDDISKRGGKFMLTNLVKSKGVTNEKLNIFSKKYKTINTSITFDNCSYQRDDKKTDIEILVKNY